MSESKPPQAINSNEHLATVLNRIQHLIQETETLSPPSVLVETSVAIKDADIPVLTEVYVGPSDQLHQVNMQDMPSLQEVLEQAVLQQTIPISEALADALLEQMQPLILKTVKLAVLEESVKLEKALTEKLQLDVLHAIKDRLIKNQPSTS